MYQELVMRSSNFLLLKLDELRKEMRYLQEKRDEILSTKSLRKHMQQIYHKTK